MTLTTRTTSRRALPLLKRVLRSVSGVAIMIGTVGLGSNLFDQPSRLTSSSSTVLYASATGSSTASCDSVANACSLQTALNSVSSSTPNITIMLITSGGLGSYTGNYIGGFTVNTGTSYNVTIENYQSNTPVLDGNGVSTVLTATGSGTLTLLGVGVYAGRAAAGSNGTNGSSGGPGANGGGINSTATLNISNSTVTQNSAGEGGSYADTGSNHGGNGGNGGGIYSTAPVTISDSTITQNSGGNQGYDTYGGSGGNNGNGGNGGGIYSTAPVTISDSTITQNSGWSGSVGGGIYSASSLTVLNSTVSGNSASSGNDIYNGGGAQLTANLIAGSVAANCTSASGASFTDSYNVSSDGTCGFTNTTTSASETNLVSSSANNLNLLGNNGGPTQTIYPQSSNPAIGFIPVTSGFCPPTDQRGYVLLPSATTCDSGAAQTNYSENLSQTITFVTTAPTDPTVGGTYAPEVSFVTSPVILSIASSSSSVCSLSNGVVSFNAVGTCTIDANQAGNSTYAPAPQVTQSITVVAAPKPPTVTTSSATSVTDSTATLNGTVNPNGTSTTYQFQYGTSTSYGSVSPSTAASAGSSTTNVAEKANLSGLKASTTYDYRIVATANGVTTDGSNKTFTTTAAPAPTPPAPTPTPKPKPKPTPEPKTSSPKFITLGQTGTSSPTSLTTPYVPGTCSNAVTGASYQVTPTGVLEDGLSGPVFLGTYPTSGNQHVVACATTPNGKGIWLVTNYGRVYAEGTAVSYGDMRSQYGICGILGTPALPYGGVPTSGQKCSIRELNAPIVGIASTPNGNGYWLVAADGGVFNFGSAKFLGSTYSYGITGLSGSHPLNSPVTGLISTPNGNGYWLVAADGGVFNFGSAPFFGSSYSTFGRGISKPNIYFQLSAQNRIVRGYLTGKGVRGWLTR